jgi:hypothetical protein
MGKAREIDPKLVENELLLTWQPVAAIAYRADVPTKTALKVLVQLAERGKVRMAKARIDGHNVVHLFKKIEYTRMMSQVVPIDTSSQEM